MTEKSGVVIRSTGRWTRVLGDDDQQIYDCSIRGKFRVMEGMKVTNPVAVGDHVKFNLQTKSNTGQISAVSDRKNFLVRKSSKHPDQVHVIAANIDCACLVATIQYPRTSQGFIDRFLVTAEAYDITPLIVFNKADLYNDQQWQKLNEWVNLYQDLGYDVLVTSAINGKHMDQFQTKLKNKVIVLAGHSGTGKSKLIKYLYPNVNLKTATLNKANKGKHTTTFAEMLQLDENTFIIDTPGLKEYGMVGFELYEISHFFPEMAEYLDYCKFNNCLHLNEPECGVKKAVEAGKIDKGRYKSYLNIIYSLQTEHK